MLSAFFIWGWDDWCVFYWHDFQSCCALIGVWNQKLRLHGLSGVLFPTREVQFHGVNITIMASVETRGFEIVETRTHVSWMGKTEWVPDASFWIGHAHRRCKWHEAAITSAPTRDFQNCGMSWSNQCVPMFFLMVFVMQTIWRDNVNVSMGLSGEVTRLHFALSIHRGPSSKDVHRHKRFVS